jgi:AraC family transcriptional regulator
VQSKIVYRSADIDAIFRGSLLIKRSSLELGWKDLTIERRSGPPGERSEETIDKHYAVLWITQLAMGERADLHGQFAHYTKYPGTLSLGMPGMLPAVRAYTRTEVVACTLEPGFMSKVEEDLDPHPIGSLHDQLGMHDAGISQLMSLLVAEAETDGTYGKLYTDSLSCALATRFHHVARARKLQGSSKNSKLPCRILRRVIERMQSDFSVNLDLETLATESGYSRAHFLRMFRAATGKTPHQYLLDLRLDEAQRRMRDPDERLIDIATECGFCSHSHLSKVFRQRFGVTPSEYRRHL